MAKADDAVPDIVTGQLQELLKRAYFNSAGIGYYNNETDTIHYYYVILAGITD